MKHVNKGAFIFLFFINALVYSQISPPYYSKFDLPADTVGWKHYALIGTDDWEWGVPLGPLLGTPFSPQKVWGTKLLGSHSTNSTMYLESPSFDLSDVSKTFRVGFAHQFVTHSTAGTAVEYSIDNGVTWALLNGLATEKANWYNGPGPYWTGSMVSYKFVLHGLASLSGQTNVKFRLKLFSGSVNYDGWMIDNFLVEEDKPNFFCQANTIGRPNKNCPTFNVTTGIVLNQLSTNAYTTTIKHYISNDTILDGLDPVLLTSTMNVNFNYLNWNYNLTLPPTQVAGTKYLFVELDANNTLVELSENDNVCMYKLIIDSVYTTPVVFDMESTFPDWKTDQALWIWGSGNKYLFENSHSGKKAWVNLNNPNPTYQNSYLQSPLFDSKNEDSTVISLWYTTKFFINNAIQYGVGCSSNFTYGNVGSLKPIATNKWGFANFYLPVAADTSKKAIIRIINGNGNAFLQNSNFQSRDLIVDDIYIGRVRADLSIEDDTKNRYTPASDVSDTLKYLFTNSGLKTAPSSSTAFYWSTDSVLNAGDVFLGFKNELAIIDTSAVWTKFIYNKPTQTPGKYFIIYILDSTNTVNEMRDYNNKGYFTLFQETKQAFPYFNDFETQAVSWRHSASLGVDEWKLTTPNKPLMPSAFSGTKAWLTNDVTTVTPNSRMHLYTPIFDLTGSIKPVLEFDMLIPFLLNIHDPARLNMSYSIDGGATWTVLDSVNKSFNRWYNPLRYDEVTGSDVFLQQMTTPNFYKASELFFASDADYNGRDCDRINHYIMDLTRFAGIKKIQFRFNMITTQPSTPNYFPSHGAMLDNFKISEGAVDLITNYKKALMLSSNSTKIMFDGKIKNNGNYISNAGLISFYLSTDSIYNASDLNIGGKAYGAIRPDNYFYFNVQAYAPGNFNQYKYLVIKSDANNTTVESNENNNITVWPLALDSLINAPYFNNFNDSIINGWYGYSIYNNSLYGHRVRNIVPPAGKLYLFNYKSGELFTDQVAAGVGYPVPVFYIQSPKFDFSGSNPTFISFDLMVTGSYYVDGSIMEYSLDGGNTWNYLNLYNCIQGGYNYTLTLYNNFGWSGQIGGGVPPSTYMIPVKADISFLSAQSDVVFRFRQKSNHYFAQGTSQGIRIDNFKIELTKVDYKANDNAVVIPQSTNTVSINYSYSSVEPYFSPATTLKFYWSNDSVFDSNDTLFFSANVASSPAPYTINDSITIDLNNFNFQTTGYVFYMIEKDSLILESNENNNVGSFIITNLVNIFKNIKGKIQMYVNRDDLYIEINKNILDNPNTITIYDALGRRVFQQTIQLEKEKTVFNLPSYLIKGLYYINIRNEIDQETIKYIKN